MGHYYPIILNAICLDYIETDMHLHNLRYHFYKVLDLRMRISCARAEAIKNYVKTAQAQTSTTFQ
jgi:hypothetical protein